MPKEKRPLQKKKKGIIQALFWEILFFCLIFVFGFFSALEAKKVLTKEEIEIPKITFEGFLFYFAVVTTIVLLLVYLPRAKRYRAGIYKFIFLFAFIYGALVVLPVFLPDLITIGLVLVLLFLWFKLPLIFIHNILIILALAGLGSVFGLAVEPKAVILLLLILSIYDFIAVYKTKHMIKMASSMLEQGVIMGIVIPYQNADFKAKIKEVKPGGKFMVLGGGDIAFPLIFAISMLDKGFFSAIIVAGFALLGLLSSLLIFLFQKEPKPIPALPPIALFSIIGYIVVVLFL